MIGWEPAFREAGRPATLPPFAVEEKPTAAGMLRELPILLVLAALIAFLLKTLVAQAFYIPSESMVPQLKVNDRVVVSKISYRLHDPRRGDIVVFDDPIQGASGVIEPRRNAVQRVVRAVGEGVGVIQPSTDEFIKRVIGLPGETVQGRGGRVYVNGKLLDEPYLSPDVVTSDFPPEVVPEGRLWVMGDNRTNSSDSRVFHTIDQGTVKGRAVLRVWPPGAASFL